jgi:hypothetical protein
MRTNLEFAKSLIVPFRVQTQLHRKRVEGVVSQGSFRLLSCVK